MRFPVQLANLTRMKDNPFVPHVLLDLSRTHLVHLNVLVVVVVPLQQELEVNYVPTAALGPLQPQKDPLTV
jgi:hypothetical protein